jgi:hypothetical protein
MGVSKLSGAIRIGLGVSLVLFAGAAGFLQRSPWILPFMGLGFTSAYLFGQLRLWRVARRTGKLKRYWLQLPADTAVQLVLVSVLYLMGFGLSALISGGVAVEAFAPGDAIWPLGVGAAASILGLYIDRIEGHPSSIFPAWMTSDQDQEVPGDDLRLLPEPVTVDSFFAARQAVLAEADPQAAADLSARSPGLSDDDITRVEARLGRALPEMLITLYKRQNGGSVTSVCIPNPGAEDAGRYTDVLMPFGGYNDLVPADTLRTVWDTVCDYTDPEAPDDAAQFPEGAKAQLVLAQWYRETLFLDYNQPGAPRVGYTDFDRYDTDGNRDAVTWWKDFETFFAALRHYEPA